MRPGMIRKILIFITIVIAAVFFEAFGSKNATFYGDGLGYYLYLPSTFIYHNIKTPGTIPRDTTINHWVYEDVVSRGDHKSSIGYTLNQYTYGVAFMEMPFFFIAHGYEKIRALPANGYSDNYELLIKISSIVYGLLGLLLIFSILRRYFTATLSLLGTLAIFIGTNLFWFMLFQAGMSHTPLFFLYALLVWLTIKLYEQPRPFLFAAIGCISGLITIIRPTDILCLLIPLLYNVYNWASLKEKLSFVRRHLKYIPVVVIAFCIPLVPQLLYWKAVTGEYLVYSYGDQSFNWLQPKIIEGLFYFSNGWLPYSPIMIFSIVGMFFFYRIKKWTWCIWLIFPAYVYIIYSWYCYTYINGLGSRPMIHLYPLLAIPLTAFIQFISTRKLWVRSLFAFVCLLFIGMNLSYSMLQEKKLLFSENSNMQFNFQMLFHTKLTYNDLVTRDIAEVQPDSNKLTKLATLAYVTYKDSTTVHYVRDTVNGAGYVYHMTPDEEYMPNTILVKFEKKKYKDAKWFKCSGWFMYPQPSYNNYEKHILVMGVDKKMYKGCEIENKIGDWVNNEIPGAFLNQNDANKWGYVYFFTKIPSDLADGDVLHVFTWNMGKRDIYVGNYRLDVYK